MKAGDLIMCDGETGVILSFWSDSAGFDEDWADVLWSMGDIAPIPIGEIDEVLHESR